MIWVWTLLVALGAALNLEELVGTWTTKSREVLTGPVWGQNKRGRRQQLTYTGLL